MRQLTFEKIKLKKIANKQFFHIVIYKYNIQLLTISKKN